MNRFIVIACILLAIFHPSLFTILLATAAFLFIPIWRI